MRGLSVCLLGAQHGAADALPCGEELAVVGVVLDSYGALLELELALHLECLAALLHAYLHGADAVEREFLVDVTAQQFYALWKGVGLGAGEVAGASLQRSGAVEGESAGAHGGFARDAGEAEAEETVLKGVEVGSGFGGEVAGANLVVGLTVELHGGFGTHVEAVLQRVDEHTHLVVVVAGDGGLVALVAENGGEQGGLVGSGATTGLPGFSGGSDSVSEVSRGDVVEVDVVDDMVANLGDGLFGSTFVDHLAHNILGGVEVLVIVGDGELRRAVVEVQGGNDVGGHVWLARGLRQILEGVVEYTVHVVGIDGFTPRDVVEVQVLGTVDGVLEVYIVVVVVHHHLEHLHGAVALQRDALIKEVVLAVDGVVDHYGAAELHAGVHHGELAHVVEAAAVGAL